MTTRILLTPGEPAGIGPDISIRIAQQSWPVELIAIADPDLLMQRAAQLSIPLRLITHRWEEPSNPQQAGTLKILPLKTATAVKAGELNIANAPYVIRTLEWANALAREKKVEAVVTGPVHKGIINQAGIPFTGHTEFFATLNHVPQTVMLFVVGKMKVALASTHIPLAKVPAALTREKLSGTLHILNQALINQFHIAAPRIIVCGINPHAGEGGYLGREEIDILIPLLNQLRQAGHNIEGPLPADTLFTPDILERADAVLAMYHDQGLPVVKYMGFGQAVNMTLGLPFIRTSVDHGTALALAGTGKAEAGSLAAAIQLALGNDTTAV